jgi:phage-related protein
MGGAQAVMTAGQIGSAVAGEIKAAARIDNNMGKFFTHSDNLIHHFFSCKRSASTTLTEQH